LPSTRRVKKGPGRRPQSAKRQRFMQLRARGWSVLAAAREVGVSRTTGANWARGYKTYRDGRPVGFVPPLDRLAVREIHPRYLSQDERFEIADLHRTGMSIRRIARQIGRSPSTVSRELRRNGRADGGYRPFDAHRHAVSRRARRHRRRLDTNPALRRLVGELLAQRWSPQQIARHLHAHYPHDPSMRLCHESIYQAVYQPGSRLIRPPKVVSAQRSPLRTGRDHRRAHQKPAQRRPRFAQPMRSIHHRPFAPSDRTEPGHWEGDRATWKSHVRVVTPIGGSNLMRV
jgi:transposase, IS30 family